MKMTSSLGASLFELALGVTLGSPPQRVRVEFDQLDWMPTDREW